MRGFTLLETLVYLALFAILVGGFVVSAYALFESSNRNVAKAMLQQEKDFVVGKIHWALSGAKVVSVPNQHRLVVTKYDTTSAVIDFDATAQALTVGGNPITNSNVRISNLVFIYTNPGGTNPESVEAGFTISTLTADGKTITQTASTTRYVRK